MQIRYSHGIDCEALRVLRRVLFFQAHILDKLAEDHTFSPGCIELRVVPAERPLRPIHHKGYLL